MPARSGATDIKITILSNIVCNAERGLRQLADSQGWRKRGQEIVQVRLDPQRLEANGDGGNAWAS